MYANDNGFEHPAIRANKYPLFLTKNHNETTKRGVRETFQTRKAAKTENALRKRQIYFRRLLSAEKKY
jgi:hypothetical protein